MKKLEIQVPDHLDLMLGVQGDESLLRETQFLLASKLFESGRLSSGPCAEIAGIPKKDFLLRLHLAGIPVVDWDEDELAAEERTILK